MSERSSFHVPHERVQCDTAVRKDMTRQEHFAECDINRIMRKYGPRELLALGGTRSPMFGDFTMVDDYQSASELVDAASAQFAELPAAVRAAHGNDPARFIAWFDNATEEELREAGLTVEEVVPPTEALAAAQLADRKAAEEAARARAELEAVARAAEPLERDFEGPGTSST